MSVISWGLPVYGLIGLIFQSADFSKEVDKSSKRSFPGSTLSNDMLHYAHTEQGGGLSRGVPEWGNAL